MYPWGEAKDCAVGLISEFVRFGDVGTGWNGDLGRWLEAKEGSRRRYFSSGGLSGVELMKRIGWYVPSRRASDLPMLTVTSFETEEREGRVGGLQWERKRNAC